MCVFVWGKVQVGPNCKRGLEHPEHRHSAHKGRLDWRNEVYIAKLGKKISAKSVVKSPASPDVGRPETSHPLRWRFWDVRKLSRMITETEHKMRFVVVAKWVQTPGPHFLLLTTCYGSRAFRAFCLISKLTIEMLKIILMTLIIRFTILKTRS